MMVTRGPSTRERYVEEPRTESGKNGNKIRKLPIWMVRMAQITQHFSLSRTDSTQKEGMREWGESERTKEEQKL